MFSVEETPFRDREVRKILKLTKEEFAQAERNCKLARNVLCHYRIDGTFNYPNYFDILSFCLEQFAYKQVETNEEPTDIISRFVDRMSCGLDPEQCPTPEDVGETVLRVTGAIKSDLFGEELREFSSFGEYLLSSDIHCIRANQRENYLCSIAVALLHRTLLVFYAPAINQANENKVMLIDQTVAVCQGKLCTYVPDDLLGVRCAQQPESQML